MLFQTVSTLLVKPSYNTEKPISSFRMRSKALLAGKLIAAPSMQEGRAWQQPQHHLSHPLSSPGTSKLIANSVYDNLTEMVKHCIYSLGLPNTAIRRLGVLFYFYFLGALCVRLRTERPITASPREGCRHQKASLHLPQCTFLKLPGCLQQAEHWRKLLTAPAPLQYVISGED